MKSLSDTTSTIFYNQYIKDDWKTRMGKDIKVEAIVDRYAYSAYWIETGIMNMREYCTKNKIQ